MLFAARALLDDLCGTLALMRSGPPEVACVTTSPVLAK